MKTIKILSILIVLATFSGCPKTYNPPPPTPIDPTSTSKCSPACDKLQSLGCPEGKPLKDGTTCAQFCVNTQNSGHSLKPECVLEKVQKCEDLDKLCS